MHHHVSIIIVHYRNYSDLTGCLRSLQAHEPGRATVVVDHASVAEELDRVREEFPGVTFVATTANPGFGAGVNRAVRELDAEHVLVLNPDCLLSGPLVAPLADYLDRQPSFAVVGPRILNEDGSVQASARRFPNITTAVGGRQSWLTALAPRNPLSRHNLLTDGGPAPRPVDWVSGACTLIRRSALDQAGGFDESFFLYWEDADLCRRLRTLGWLTAYFPGVSVMHAAARSSRVNARASLVAFHVSAMRYYYRHSGMIGRCASPLVAIGLAGRLAVSLILHSTRVEKRPASTAPHPGPHNAH